MSSDRPERRRHKRHKLACPLRLSAAEGGQAADGKAQNISDGGVLASVPARLVPACGGLVEVYLRVPRATANTYMLEEFSCRATVVRHEASPRGPTASVALAFTKPLDLALEV